MTIYHRRVKNTEEDRDLSGFLCVLRVAVVNSCYRSTKADAISGCRSQPPCDSIDRGVGKVGRRRPGPMRFLVAAPSRSVFSAPLW